MRSAARDPARIDKPHRLRISAAVDGLQSNPHQGTLLKEDMSGLRRIRVGDYRVIYEVNQDELIVLAVTLDHRRHVYR